MRRDKRISYGFSISLYGTDKSNPGAPRNSPCIGLPSNAIFDTLCSHNETEEAITKELQFIEEKKSDEASLYSKIAQAYITGGSLHYNDMIKEALPYLETAMNLSKQLLRKSKSYLHRSLFGNYPIHTVC